MTVAPNASWRSTLLAGKQMQPGFEHIPDDSLARGAEYRGLRSRSHSN